MSIRSGRWCVIEHSCFVLKHPSSATFASLLTSIVTIRRPTDMYSVDVESGIQPTPQRATGQCRASVGSTVRITADSNVLQETVLPAIFESGSISTTVSSPSVLAPREFQHSSNFPSGENACSPQYNLAKTTAQMQQCSNTELVLGSLHGRSRAVANSVTN